MRILVCGGRGYDDVERVYSVLDMLHYKKPITCIIHGGARGADKLAGEFARATNIEEIVFLARWRNGKRAGPIRNQKMLDEGRLDVVVAFPGGAGTADMVRRAKAANIKVIEIGGEASAEIGDRSADDASSVAR